MCPQLYKDEAGNIWLGFRSIVPVGLAVPVGRLVEVQGWIGDKRSLEYQYN